MGKIARPARERARTAKKKRRDSGGRERAAELAGSYADQLGARALPTQSEARPRFEDVFRGGVVLTGL